MAIKCSWHFAVCKEGRKWPSDVVLCGEDDYLSKLLKFFYFCFLFFFVKISVPFKFAKQAAMIMFVAIFLVVCS